MVPDSRLRLPYPLVLFLEECTIGVNYVSEKCGVISNMITPQDRF